MARVVALTQANAVVRRGGPEQTSFGVGPTRSGLDHERATRWACRSSVV